ncbi:MAG: hypothetical protein HYY63_01465, partial [Elusimicrobia bacterium]|nr:hypothetical protein [Elusimicrobiota bacterium]
LALSFGITPFLLSLRKGVILLQVPGEQKVRLKLPGSYIAVCLEKNLTGADKQRLQDLEYSLFGKSGDIEVLKFPSRVYATDRGSDQIPLFQFVAEKAGNYTFSSGYAYDMEGPKIKAVLFHTDLGYVRTELFVGLGMFLVLGVLGFYFIRRNYKSSIP